MKDEVDQPVMGRSENSFGGSKCGPLSKGEMVKGFVIDWLLAIWFSWNYGNAKCHPVNSLRNPT